ncbi:Growth hormone-regulated TBC protein 1-A [Phytophthora ramorum]|uniref:Growth hormone-regulated TBC protein 1-A n=1 Tax=Phytophthora ramorum TaxID=164328 RepID=UPI003099A7A9|nr:Growth hormone-regulated TBC protein 1-A [Phytophthora ramorum]
MKSPSHGASMSGSDRIGSPASSLPELSIFPAFTPDPIRLAELVGSATYSPPVSPTAAEARELFASIGDGQTFFELLEARGLTLVPTDGDVESSDETVDVVHCVDGRRKTLLHQACRCGNVQVAKCLLFHGANASAQCRDGRTPFHDAAAISSGKTAVELLKLLFEHDPKGISIVDANGSHVLHLAAIHGNLEVIRWCAGLSAQPAGKRLTVRSPRPAISRYMTHLGVTAFSGRNMLHYAAYNGRLDVLKWLLDGENSRRGELTLSALDTNGYSVLHYAAMGASLVVCEWLVLEAPERHQLNLTARTSEGKTAGELASARPAPIRNFLIEVSRVPSVPSGLRCLGADTTSLGVGWDIEPASTDARLWETLKPLYFHLEICKKPVSLSHASGFLTMLMLMPPTSPASPRAPSSLSSALISASHLLHWVPLGVLLQPEAREHWLCGLDRDTEYLVRMRVRNRNGFSGYSLPNLSGVFTTSDGGRRRRLSSLQRFFGAIKMEPPMEAIATCFIGDLHFELLEARGLPRPYVSHILATPMSPSLARNTLKAAQGRYYGVISIETPSTPDVELSGTSYSSRLIYCVRSPLATLQQDLVFSGSSQIQVDLKRTFAGNDECWLTSDAGQKSLERVLLAYALHNDALGYCQSMTFVVGRLLCLCQAQFHVDKVQNATDLPFEEEERVFWLLHVICEDFFPAYYTQGMTGLQVDGAVLERLLRSRLPKVYRHFQQLHAPPMGLVLATQWMLPICCAVFPSETTFRFLDVLFFEGPSVVFAVAIALLRISQHELIAENMDYSQLFRFLRARDQRLHDAPLLMEVAYEEHQLLAAQVDSLRQRVAQELGIDQNEDTAKPLSTTKLSKLPVDELRPGDVDIHI